MKKKKSIKETTKHKPKVTPAKPNYLAFALEVLPKSFEKTTSKEISFIKEIVKRMNLSKEYFKEDLTIELTCFLDDISINTTQIINFYTTLLQGIVFKKESQLMSITIKKVDVKTDPFNKGRPFVGIVIRKVKKYTKEELTEKEKRYGEIKSEIKDLGG